MPKETNKKNNKAKTTKAETSKKVTTKKSSTKKAPVKKVEPKKVEIKEVEVKKVVKEEKKGKNELITKVVNNTPFVVSLCVIVLLIAVLIFVACYKRVPKTSKGKEIIATLKGKTITADDLYEELKSDNGTTALMNLIDEYIANKEYPKLNSDDKKYVQDVVDYYKDYADYYKVDLETFLTNYVGLAGITTEEEFYNYVSKDYKKTLAIRKFVADSATEDELKAYYKENYTDKLTVKHILIEVDADAEDQEAADKEAKAKAEKLIEKLNDTSAKKLDAKFEELAEENSDDTATYSKGGLIEDFTKKDVVEEFWNAANKLKDGEYTKEPVKTTYGYHIILKVSSTPVEKYKDIKDEVKSAYAESLLSADNTLFTTKWAELRKQYKLSIKDDVMKKWYKDSLKVSDNSDAEEKTEETTEE